VTLIDELVGYEISKMRLGKILPQKIIILQSIEFRIY
jgi:hypothetical protein